MPAKNISAAKVCFTFLIVMLKVECLMFKDSGYTPVYTSVWLLLFWVIFMAHTVLCGSV